MLYLRTTFDIVCNALFNHGLTQNVLSKNIYICFYKYAHNSGQKGSPDMILTAFNMKFDETKDGMPPGACRPLKKLKTNSRNKTDPKQIEKNNVEQVGSYILIYLHILSYTFIYLHIPSYTFIYLHMPLYTFI